MASRYGALLDACTMVPIALADTMLRLAERELYRPLWSSVILDEACDAVKEVHPDADVRVIDSRFSDMADAFEDATVTGREPLVDSLTLPDPDDRHVLAAAVRGGAQSIVTFDLDDFPDAVLGPLGLEAPRAGGTHAATTADGR